MVRIYDYETYMLLAISIEMCSDYKAEELGISINAQNEELGLPIGTLSAYRDGSKHPPVRLLPALSDYYDVSIDYLFGRSER